MESKQFFFSANLIFYQIIKRAVTKFVLRYCYDSLHNKFNKKMRTDHVFDLILFTGVITGFNSP